MNEPFNEKGPEALFCQADKLIEKGEVVKATGTLTALLNELPSFGRAYNHLGYLWETKFRDLTKAEGYYKQCLKHSPEYPAVYYNYAVLLCTQKRFDELESLLKKALKVTGINESKIYNEYGILYELKGKFSEALDSYRKAIRFSFSPKDIDTYQTSIARIQDKMVFLGQGVPAH